MLAQTLNRSGHYDTYTQIKEILISFYTELDLAHRRTNANCIHQKENSPKPGLINHHLTLKEEPKVKSDHIERLLAQDFLQVGVTLQTPRSMNMGDISTTAGTRFANFGITACWLIANQ